MKVENELCESRIDPLLRGIFAERIFESVSGRMKQNERRMGEVIEEETAVYEEGHCKCYAVGVVTLLQVRLRH